MVCWKNPGFSAHVGRIILSTDVFNLLDNQNPAWYDVWHDRGFGVPNPNFGEPIIPGTTSGTALLTSYTRRGRFASAPASSSEIHRLSRKTLEGRGSRPASQAGSAPASRLSSSTGTRPFSDVGRWLVGRAEVETVGEILLSTTLYGENGMPYKAVPATTLSGGNAVVHSKKKSPH